MAPIRRYLRVSRTTVLEVRIHMDNPADTARWLLRTGSPALPRVIDAVRPLIVPKLREENERVRRGKKKHPAPVKDVLVGDDFEVTVFFTEGGTPHAVMKRHKVFAPKTDQVESGKGGDTQERPLDVDSENGDVAMVRRESDDAEDIKLEDVPAHNDDDGTATQDNPAAISDDSDHDDDDVPDANTDEKKKLGFTATYEGFRIYGYTLYLVVKRIGTGNVAGETQPGQSLMEGWIASTQTAPPWQMID